MSSIDVHLNRDRPRSIEAPPQFTAHRTFEVYVENHGDGSHIHLRLDDRLSRVATLRDGNEFVPAGESARIRVDVRPVDSPVTGTLTISIGYGAETADVDVTVDPSTADRDRVEVDESLANPQYRETEDGRRIPPVQTVALLGLAAVAVAAAIGAALYVRSAVVVAGAAVVVLAVLATVAAALR